MLTYVHVLKRSVGISGALLLLDLLLEFLLKPFLGPFEVLGDLLLAETALLFLTAGLIDFGSSLGFVNFRRAIRIRTFVPSEPFSLERRKNAERRALVLVASGSTLFAILIFLGIVR